MGFYRPFTEEHLPLTESEWRSQAERTMEFRDFLIGHARALFREIANIFDERIVHEFEPLKMNKKESKIFWRENSDFLLPGDDRFVFPPVAFEIEGRSYEFENGLFFQKTAHVFRGEGFGELGFKDG